MITHSQVSVKSKNTSSTMNLRSTLEREEILPRHTFLNREKIRKQKNIELEKIIFAFSFSFHDVETKMFGIKIHESFNI